MPPGPAAYVEKDPLRDWRPNDVFLHNSWILPSGRFQRRARPESQTNHADPFGPPACRDVYCTDRVLDVPRIAVKVP